VLSEVLANLTASARSSPRAIFVLYNAPFEKQEFERIPELRIFHQTSQYQLYRVELESAG
jgi:hypothetical protein